MRSVLVAAGGGSLLAVVVMAAFVAFGGDDDRPRSRMAPNESPPVVTNADMVRIDAIDDDFDPANVSIKAGATIVWQFVGDRPHTVTDGQGAFDSGVLERGKTFSWTFDTPGEYSYYCTLHHAMQGTISVRP
jgi:plastocyanin